MPPSTPENHSALGDKLRRTLIPLWRVLAQRGVGGITIFLLFILLSGGAKAQNGSWNTNTNGSWTNPAVWLTNGIAGATNSTTSTGIATFTNAVSGVRTVTVNTNRNIGGISFGSTSNGFTLSGGSLILSSNGIIQTDVAAGGTNTISSPVFLVGNGTFTANGSASSLLSIGAVANSTAGSVTLTLNGANTGSNAVTGILGNGTNGGTLAVAKDGSGSWRLTGANTFTGGVSLNSGTLQVTTSANALGAGALTLNGGTLDLAHSALLAFNRNTTVGGNSTIITEKNTAGAGVTYTFGTLAIGANTLTVQGGNVTSGTAGLTFGATTLNGNATFDISNPTGGGATLLTLGAITGGNNSVTKNGSGALTLSSSNDFNGGITVNAGQITTGAANALSSNAVTVNDGGTLAITNNSQANVQAVTLGSGTISGTTGILTGTSYNATNSGAAVISVILGGPGTLTKTGTGTLTLSGANTFSGGIFINAGQLTAGLANALGSNAVTVDGGTLAITNNSQANVQAVTLGSGTISGTTGVLTGTSYGVSNSSTALIGAILGGSGALTKSGTGTLTLTGANTFSGGATLNAGTILIGNAGSGVIGNITNSSVGTGALTLNGGTIAGDSTTSRTINNALVIGGDLAFGQLVGGTASLTFGAGVNLGTGGRTFTVNNYTAFNGVITNTGSLIKAGTGTLVLATNNTYSGGITLNEGTILLGANTTTLGIGTVTLNGGTIASSNSGNRTNNNTLVIGGDVTFGQTATGTGTLTFGGGVDLGTVGRTLTVNSGTILSGAITNTGSLTKAGAGTLTLTASNNYSGGTILNQGGLSISNNAAFGTGTVNLASNSSITALANLTVTNDYVITSGAAGTFSTTYLWTNSGVISGGGGLTKAGAGTITLAGSNSYSGGTTLNQGGLSISNNAAFGTGVVTLASNSTITALTNLTVTNDYVINAGATTTFSTANLWTNSGVISGGGSLTKAGAGTLTLTGSNSFTGNVTISAGTLSATSIGSNNVASAMGAGTLIAIGAGTTASTLNYLGAGNTTDRQINLDVRTTTATINNNGSGRLLFTGLFTNSNAGQGFKTLQLGGSNSGEIASNLTDAAPGTAAAGATVTNGATTITLGSTNGITRDSAISGPGIAAGTTVSSFGGGNQVVISQALTGTLTAGNLVTNAGIVNPMSLTKSGAGTWTLSGTNSYSGTTTVSAGVLSITTTNALPGWDTSGRYSVASSATLAVQNEIDETAITNMVYGTINFAPGSAIGFDTAIGINRTYSQVISNSARGSLGMTKLGEGTLTLSASNTYTGISLVNGGTLVVGNSNALGATNGILSVINGILDLNGYSITKTSVTGNASGVITNSSDTQATLTITNISAVSNASTIAGNLSLAKRGTGTLTLSGANTFNGGIILNTGQITAGAEGALSSNTVTINNGTTLAIGTNNQAYVGAVTLGNGSITGTSGVLTGTSYSATNSGAAVISAILGGTGALTKEGSGNLTLSGANTFNGGITINSGQITAGAVNTLGINDLTINNGTTLAIGTNDQANVGAVTLGNGSITGTTGVMIGTSYTATNSGEAVISAILGGTGALTKEGSGNLTLSGANTFNSGIILNQGGLSISDNAAFGTGTITVASNSTITALTNLTVTNSYIINPAATATFSTVNNWTNSRSISGDGSFTKTGSGTVTLSGVNTFNGGITINEGQITAGAVNTLGINDLTINNGTTLAIGTNDQANVGAVTLGNGSITGTTGVFNGTSYSATNSGAAVISAILGGTGSLTKTGAGNLTLSGANTFNGGIILNTGQITAGAEDALSSNTVTINNGTTLAISTYNQANVGAVTLGNGTITGATGVMSGTSYSATNSGAAVISAILGGTGALTKEGSGNLTLSGANTFNGGIILNAGQITAGTIGALGSNAVTVNDGTALAIGSYNQANVGAVTLGNGLITGTTGVLGGTNNFLVDNSNAASISAKLGGTGSFTKKGAGALTLSGSNNNFLGAIVVQSGTIALANTTALGGGGISITNATLDTTTLSNTPIALGGGSMSLIGGATLKIQSVLASPVITNVGNLTISGANNLITNSNSDLNLGTYVLIAATNITANGSIGYVIGSQTATLNGAPVTVGRTGYALSNSATQLQLIVDGGACDLVWTGASGNTWSTNLANKNWVIQGTNTMTSFYENDSVAFTNLTSSTNIVVQSPGVSAYGMNISSNTGTLSFSGGSITNSGLTISDASAVFSNRLSVWGNWTVENASVTLRSNTALTGGLSLGNATLTVDNLLTNSGANVTLESSTVNGSGTMSITYDTSFTASGSNRISSAISGSGGLTKLGPGTLILSGGNTFTGITTISQGTLQIGSSNAIAGPILVAGGILDMTSFSDSVGVVTLGSGTITGGTGTLTGTSYSVTNGLISAILGGSGALTKNGSGTVILSGTNRYSGGTTLNEGVLSIDNNAAFGTGTITVASDSTITALTNLTITNAYSLGAGVTATFDSGANLWTNSGLVSGSGALIKEGSGTLTLSRSNTFNGGITLNAGQITAGAIGALSSNDLTINDGTTLAIGTNRQANVGAVTLGNGTVTGTTGVLTGTSYSATNSGVAVVSAILGGSAGLTKTGDGILFLTSNNTYSGITTISDGILSIATSNTLAGWGSTNYIVKSGGALAFGGGFTDAQISNSVYNSGKFATGSAFGFDTAIGINRIYSQVISNTAQGPLGLVKVGPGILTLTNNNTYTGLTTVSQGVLSVAAPNTFPGLRGTNFIVQSGASLAFRSAFLDNDIIALVYKSGDFLSNSALGFDTSDSYRAFYTSISNTANGPLGVTKVGSNVLALMVSNSYSGPTTITVGTLQIGNSNALGTGTLVFNGGALSSDSTTSRTITNNYSFLNNATIGDTINNGTLTFTGAGDLGNVARTLTNNSTVIISGVLNNTAGLTKAGSGTLILSPSNIFTGSIAVSGGTLMATNSISLGASNTPITVSGTGTLNLGSNSFTRTGLITFSGGTVTNGTLINNTTNFSGQSGIVAANLVGSASLTKTGAGTLTLSGSNGYTGNTILSNGVLSITSTNALPGWNLDGRYSVASNATLAVGNSIANSTITNMVYGTTNFAAGSAIGFDTTTGNRTNSLVLSNTAQGALGLTKVGTNILTLSGTNSYTGVTRFGAGVLVLANSNALAGGGDLTFIGGTLQYGTGITNDFSDRIGNSTAVINIDSGSNAITFARTIASDNTAGLAKLGVGTLTLAGSNSYTGPSTITAGTLQIGNSNALGAGTLVFNGGSLSSSSSNPWTITNNFNLSSAAILGNSNPSFNGTLTFIGNGNLGTTTRILTNNSSVIITGALTNTAGFTKAGSGTLTLSGINTYGGPTTITAGIVQIGNDNALSTNTLVFNGGGLSSTDTLTRIIANRYIFSNNAILGDTNPNFNGGFSFTGSGVLANTNSILTVNSDVDISGNLTNASGITAGFTKAGGGILTLSASNSYNGPTTINEGTLQIGNSNALAGGGDLVFNGGGLSSDSTNSRRITNDFILLGNGFLGNSTNVNYKGALTFTGTGDLGANTRTITVESPVTFSGPLINTAGFTKAGSGTLTLSGTNTYTGPTTINAGTLLISGSGSLGGGNYAGAITNNASLIFSNSVAQTLRGSISGSGTLTKSGTGTLTLTASNNYSGGTILNQGSLSISNNASFGTGGVTVVDNSTITALTNLTVTNDYVINSEATVTFSTARLWTNSGSISGDGSFSKTGAGTLILSGSNSYTGIMTVSAGRLTLIGSNSLGDSNSPIMVTNTGTLDLGSNSFERVGLITFAGGIVTNGTLINNGESDYNALRGIVAANLAGSASLTKSGPGMLTLSGSNSYSFTTISEGILSIATTNALPGWDQSGSYSVESGATLAVYNEIDDKAIIDMLSTTNFAAGSFIGFDTTSGNRTIPLDLSNTVQGELGLNKVGANTLTLTGSNSYSGSTLLTAGTLQIGNSNALGTGTLVFNGGALSSDSINIRTITNNFLFNTNATLGNTNTNYNGELLFTGTGDFGTNTNNLTITVNSSVTMSGDLTNAAGNTNAFIKAGAGTLTLSGTNSSFQGAIVVQNGTLSVSSIGLNGSNSSVGAGTIVTLGSANPAFRATLNYLGTGETNNRQISLNATNVTTINNNGSGTLAFTGVFTNTTNGGTLQLGGTNAGEIQSNLDNPARGAVALIKTNAGTWLLSGTNTYTGGTIITEGTLLVGNDSAIGASNGPLTVTDTGTLDLGSNSFDRSGLITFAGGSVTNGTLINTGTNYNALSGTVSATLAGTEGLTKTGSGTLTLSGSNSYEGETLVTNGTLIAANAGALSTNMVTVRGSVRLDLGSNTFTNTFALGSGTIANGTISNNANMELLSNGTVSAGIAGSGALIKGGADTLTLSGTNSYEGGTLLTNGSIVAVNAGALSSNMVTVRGSVRLDLGSNTFTNTFALGSGTIANGTISNNANMELLSNGTVSAAITGSGELWKWGTGTLTLTASNSYANTQLMDGVIVVGNTYALGSTDGRFDIISGTLSNSGYNLTVSSVGLNVGLNGGIIGSGTITATREIVANINGSVRVANSLAGNVAFTQRGTGTTTLSASNSYSGGTLIIGGTVNANNTNALGSGSLTMNNQGLGSQLALTNSNTILRLGNGINLSNATIITLGPGSSITNTGAITISGGNNIINLTTNWSFSAGSYPLITGTNLNIPLALKTNSISVTNRVFGLIRYGSTINVGGIGVVGGTNYTFSMGRSGLSTRSLMLTVEVPPLPIEAFPAPANADIPAAALDGGVKAISVSPNGISSALNGNGGVAVWNGLASVTNVPSDLSSGVTNISAGYSHMMALKNGRVTTWGQISTPIPARALSGVVAISAGRDCLAIRQDGGVVGWGGKYLPADPWRAYLIVSQITNAIGISDGRLQGLALLADGTVVGFGVPFGTASDAYTEVRLLGLTNVAAVSEGNNFAMALKKDGSVVVWGNNSMTNVPTNAMSGVISISAGWNYAVACKSDGSVVAWGNVPANLPTNSIQATAVEAGTSSLLIGRQNVAGRALDDCQTSGGLQNNPFINNGGNNGARALPIPRATPPSRLMPGQTTAAPQPGPGRVPPPPR